MESVDLAKLTVGDVIVERGGAEYQVSEVVVESTGPYPVRVTATNHGEDLLSGRYTYDGTYIREHECDRDIVKVRPAVPFTVSVGKIADGDLGGAKYDRGKVLFRPLTRGLARSLHEVARVLTFGANKYAEDSWQTVPNAAVRYENALDRHLNAWKLGESYDPESGLHHLAHAACNVLFILWFELKGVALK